MRSWLRHRARRRFPWGAGTGGEFRSGREEGAGEVDRRKTGSKHHLICDGRDTPLKVITTAANVNDVTQTLALVDGSPPVAGRPGRPRRRPDTLLGDKGYDSNPNRDELRHRRILPDISRKGAPNIKGLGKLRYVVEQTFALLHHFKRLAIRWERRTELQDAFVSLACGLICWRRLKKARFDCVTNIRADTRWPCLQIGRCVAGLLRSPPVTLAKR
ncbi:transposase [Streptomyces sp. NPDC000341]|uniref:transposase n=1 Tax=Streptomyces sp. NPDC000341 TaxID=3156645 RepID=UPI00332D6AA8